MNGGIPAELLEARTPAEAKRHWMIDRLWTLAIASLVLLSSLVAIIWLGAWPNTLAQARLSYLGAIAFGLVLQVMFISVYFALGGPVGRWRATWGNRSIVADDDEAARVAYDAGAPLP